MKRELIMPVSLATHRTSTWFNAVLLAAAALMAPAIPAATLVGPWTPIFKGVDHSVSTNIPGAGASFGTLQVVHAFRVDLKDPDIRLFTNPRITNNYVADQREVGGYTPGDFLKNHHLQAVINANFFSSTSYYLPAGTPMDVYGLSISEGIVVSAQSSRNNSAVLLFDTNNVATVVHTNWPARSTQGIYTAVAGNGSLVAAGKNVASRTATDRDPRTAFGLSEDHRYLYLVGVDGRQPGYSNGSTDYETAGWMLLFGAYDAVNMDGGGSTTLVIEDSTGKPVRMNESSAVADSGKERTVGSHFGVYAKPVPGFLNDIQAIPDDTTAQIQWNTLGPATSEVLYGETADLGLSSGLQSGLVTNHLVQLSGLVPGATYYYQVASTMDGQSHVSPSYVFTTTNYVVTNLVFDLTNAWRYTTTSQDQRNWTAPGYDDSAWSEPGPGLLWVDVRATGPNPLVDPKNTQMPADPANSGYPFVTYYFRSTFVVDHVTAGSSLAFSGFIDDGAVLYLNGSEIYRLRMPATAVNTTLASSYPCSGDATCLDEFTVASAADHLVAGVNTLAAEVHNYNLRSADITFGLNLSLVEPVPRQARLAIEPVAGGLRLKWDAAGFVLQSAGAAQGPWTDVEGATQSPFTVNPLSAGRFYRLRK